MFVTYSIAQIWVFVSIFLLEFTGARFAHYKKRIKNREILDNSDPTYEKDRKIIGNISSLQIPQQDLSKRIMNLEKKLINYPEYAKVYNKVSSSKGYMKNKRIPEWYSLHSTATTLRDLSKLLNMEKYYLTLYSDFSTKVHPGDAMNAVIVNNV